MLPSINNVDDIGVYPQSQSKPHSLGNSVVKGEPSYQILTTPRGTKEKIILTVEGDSQVKIKRITHLLKKFLWTLKNRITKTTTALTSRQTFYVNQILESKLQIFQLNDSEHAILEPFHITSICWDLFYGVLFLIFLISSPLSISFGMQQSQITISVIQATTLIADALISLIKTRYIFGLKISSRKRLLNIYLKEDLPVDFLSFAIIIILTAIESTKNHAAKFFIFIIFTMTRYQTIKAKILELMRALEICQNQLLKLIALAGLLIIVTHIVACMWISVAQSSWVLTLESQDDSQIYLQAFSWVINLVTPFGTNNSQKSSLNNSELLFMTFAQILILLVAPLYFYKFYELLNQDTAKNPATTLHRYMRYHNVNPQLQYTIKQSLENTVTDQIVDLNLLSKDLAVKLQNEIWGKYVQRVDFFKNYSKDFQEKVVPLFTRHEMRAGDQIDDSEKLILVTKGLLKRDFFISSTITQQGSTKFDSLIDSNKAKVYKTIQNTSILFIDLPSFKSVLKCFQKDWEVFHQISHEIIFNRNYKDSGIQCQICNSEEHPIEYCPLVTPTFNKETIIIKSLFQHIQGRRFFNRRGRSNQKWLGQKSVSKSSVSIEYGKMARLMQYKVEDQVSVEGSKMDKEESISGIQSHKTKSIKASMQFISEAEDGSELSPVIKKIQPQMYSFNPAFTANEQSGGTDEFSLKDDSGERKMPSFDLKQNRNMDKIEEEHDESESSDINGLRLKMPKPNIEKRSLLINSHKSQQSVTNDYSTLIQNLQKSQVIPHFNSVDESNFQTQITPSQQKSISRIFNLENNIQVLDLKFSDAEELDEVFVYQHYYPQDNVDKVIERYNNRRFIVPPFSQYTFSHKATCLISKAAKRLS